MPTSIPPATLEKFTSFGDLLRFLRRRAGITQMELAIAVGYSDAQISRLEQGLRLPDLPTIQARFVSALDLEDEPNATARLLELAGTVRREDAPALGLCPYKGLSFFDEADADLFVGRETLVAKLTECILSLTAKGKPKRERFLVVVGASGSGKSSLVRAGVVPALRWDPRSAGWPIHVLTPTARPLESLATSLTPGAGSVLATTTLMDDLARDPRSLGLYIKRALNTTGASYALLVIDQFEELFALCRAEEERLCFIKNLLTAASEVGGQAIVLITLRADFYAHCASYSQLREALASHQEYIGAMSDEELRRAIEEPARRGRWEFEPGLVDLILHDVGHEPGALPLLSHALMETWQRRQGHRLTLSGYTSAGGVSGSIAETAEAVFSDQFTSEQQIIARRIFLRLTEFGDDRVASDTRRSATFGELILKPEDADATRAVLKALADARLVTTGENSVQVAHEALIREWPTLRGWLEDNREGLRLHRHLTQSAQEWLASGCEPGLLYRGARLAQAREWAALQMDELNAPELDFLTASIELNEREIAEREEQRQRELQATQKLAEVERQRADDGIRAARRLKRRAIIASGVGVLAIVLAVFGLVAWRSSAAQAVLNRSLRLASAAQQANRAGQTDLSLALAMEAASIDHPSSEALQALRTAAFGPGTRLMLNGHSMPVTATAMTPDGERAVSGSCAKTDEQGSCVAGELILWELKAGKQLYRWTAHSGRVEAVVFASDGQTIISGGADGSIIVWDGNGGEIRRFGGHIAEVSSLAIVADTGTLISGSTDGSLILWDWKTGEMLRHVTGALGPVTALAAAPNASIVVSGHQDGSLLRWELNDAVPVLLAKGDGAPIHALAFGPDGSWILSTSGVPDLALRKLDARSGKVLQEQTVGCSPDNLALTPDGSTALVSCEYILHIWDVRAWREKQALSANNTYINDVALSQDGRLGLSAASDGSLRLWDLVDQLDYRIYDTNVDGLDAIATSSDGNYLLLGNLLSENAQGPFLWDIASKQIIRTFPGVKGSIAPNAVQISPSGLMVAAAGKLADTISPAAMLWDLESGEILCRFGGYDVAGRQVAFSPDSGMLLIGSQDQTTRTGQLFLWDVKTCQVIREFDTHEDVSSIVFSADGKRAITGTGYFGRVVLWDVTTGHEIKRFTYSDYAPVLDIDFGPGERTVLNTSRGDLYAADVQSGDLVRRFTGHSAVPWSLDVSPDGAYLLSGSDNGEVILWNLSTGEELAHLKLPQAVYSVTFSPDGGTAFAASLDGGLLQWKIAETSLAQLLDWIHANRYVRPLTCDERNQYLVEPLCKLGSKGQE